MLSLAQVRFWNVARYQCVAQFCGNDPEVLLAAGKMVQHMCDAVDLNLGCPQDIARRGRYGSFLLEETELITSIVRTLHEGLDIPVTCKIRCLPTLEATIALALALQDAGCQMLTVHGRTKEENKVVIAVGYQSFGPIEKI